MGLHCNRHCINQVESVCFECDHSNASICTMCGAIKYTSECWCEAADDDQARSVFDSHDDPDELYHGGWDKDSIEQLNDHPQANEARMSKIELKELSNHPDAEVRSLARHILNHRHD